MNFKFCFSRAPWRLPETPFSFGDCKGTLFLFPSKLFFIFFSSFFRRKHHIVDSQFFINPDRKCACRTNKNIGGRLKTAALQKHLKLSAADYIIPPIPPAGIAGAGSFSGISVMAHSVVRNMPATEAAFSRAIRDTFVGSMTPASNMFTYSSVRAL